MKTATRPQYHRLQRTLELIHEGTRTGSLPNCDHFMRELEVSRRTLRRDLDFLRDDLHAPIALGRPGFMLWRVMSAIDRPVRCAAERIFCRNSTGTTGSKVSTYTELIAPAAICKPPVWAMHHPQNALSVMLPLLLSPPALLVFHCQT